MKKKFKNILRLFALGTVFVLGGCEKEEIFDVTKKQNTKITEKSFHQLQNDSKFSSIFLKLPHQNTDISTDGKTALEELYHFTIDEVKPAKVFEKDSVTSYTMLIKRKNQEDTYFENLVLQVDYLNRMKARIIKYTPTQPMVAVPEDNSFTFVGKRRVSKLELDGSPQSNASCEWVTIVLCDYGGHTHLAGANCGQTYTISRYVCTSLDDDLGTSGGGNDGGLNSGSNGGYGGNGNGGSSGNGSNPNDPNSDGSTPIVTAPVGPSSSTGSLQTSPCLQLSRLLNPGPTNADLKPSFAWLQSQLEPGMPGNFLEFGIEVKKNMNATGGGFHYTKTQVSSQNEFSVELTSGQSNIGSLHSHPFNGYAIPSYIDLKWLIDCYDNLYPSKQEDAFSMVVGRDKLTGDINVYGLKINNPDIMRAKIYEIWNSPKYSGLSEKDKIDAILKEQGENVRKNGQQEQKAFLEQFGNFGFDLLKLNNDDSDTFNKLELQDDPINPTQKIVTSNPC